MNEPQLVSVIMPVYNAARFLNKAIDSILQQTFTQFEFIIINDCSTDASDSIIRSYQDSRIVYHTQASNQGVVAAMNKGIALATGNFIAVMHADDISLPHRLQKQIDYLSSNPFNAVVAGKSTFINEHDEPTGQQWKLDEETDTAEKIKAAMIKENCISHPTVMFRKEAVEKYGYTSAAAHKGFAVEDYPLWLNLLSDGYTIEKIKEPVLLYRVHSTSATSEFLRSRNPFLINYYCKKDYLQQRLKKGKLNGFDKAVQLSMYLDYAKAMGKQLKQRLMGK